MDESKGSFRMRRVITATFVIVLVIVLVFGCKTQSKVEVKEQIETKEEVKNNIQNSRDESLAVDIKRAIQQAILEQLNINKTEQIYDTSKPIDSLTGKPPLLSESVIKLRKKIETETIDNSWIKQNQSANEVSLDNSQKKTTIDSSIESKSESNKVNEINVFLKWLGISAIIIVVLFLVYWLSFKRDGVL